VYKSYYAVLITEKQLQYVQESIRRLEKMAGDMNQMFKNGFVEKLDIDKTTVSLNNTRTAEIQLKNGILIGYAVLKMNLGLQQTDSLVLRDKLTTDELKAGILDDNFSYDNRNEIKLLNKAKELQGYDIRRWKLSYFPTLAAFYGYQRAGQRRAGDTGGNSPWFWYSTNQVGLNISVPIFDGNNKKYKISQARLNLEKVENTLDLTKKGIDLEAQEKNMQLAERVFNTVKKKYEQGVGSSFESLQADTELQQSQSNYFRALYDAVIAKISYLKASGKL
jgi:outer membrane protein TolC